jgi:putative hemin transport protein
MNQPHSQTAEALRETPQGAAEIRARFDVARRAGKRAKDAAESLGLSEGAAVAAHAGQHEFALKATPLHGPWVELLQGLEACGEVMALTRNEAVVHEKTGVYRNVSGSGHIGLALGEEIDLRLFFDRWHAGFALSEPANAADKPPSQSLQFFDRHGVALHKIFVREATDRAAFDALVARFAEPSASVEYVAATPAEAPRADAQIDAAGLATAWGEMTDTHQFFGLLKKFEVERQQALRLTQGRFTERAPKATIKSLLDEAAMDNTSIMVFVGSPGCIQIHTGPVRRIEPLTTPGAQWLNVLDPGFNLHLREDMIDTVWIVRKPTSDGDVTSVEAFDTSGTLMAMFFGARKPGTPELSAWRELVARLPRLS